MAESNPISSASTRLTSTTTVMSTLYMTQTITIPNPNGTSLSTTMIATGTNTIELRPTQTALPPAYHMDPNAKDVIAPGPVSSRAAIAGGVTGSLAAVAAVGIVAFLFWKRRRTRECKESNMSFTGKFLSFNSRRSDDGEKVRQGKGIHAQEVYRQEGPPQLRPIVISHTPIIEDSLIRMSLAHWDRPFAHEDQDPFRDPEKQTGHLRVTNPDISISRASTPSESAHVTTPGGFLSRQKSALAAALTSFRSSSQLSLPVHTPSDTQSPLIYEHLSRDLRVPPAALVASSMLRPKASTSSDMLHARRLSDPFLDPRDIPPRRPPASRILSGPPAVSHIRHVQSRTPSYNDRPQTYLSSRAVENNSAPSSTSSGDRRGDRISHVTERSDPFEFDTTVDGYSPPWSGSNWIRHGSRRESPADVGRM
ncbi:hypothetical protein BDZ85DRAFT_270038 [Elsinoe ampelina]|uniref:Uncharacterized protein n=1 Tax=Elsinoe ampelina TaxID=302913 RepID=A0A6A6FYS9_9PEZI|nr:hypothetical protein BDZ85DRAFT_270038 [Elsinoe ampelina]